MHEKVLLTDGRSPDSGDVSLLIGTMNLSPTSLTENRELALTLDQASGGPIIAAVQQTFDEDFAASLGRGDTDHPPAAKLPMRHSGPGCAGPFPASDAAERRPR